MVDVAVTAQLQQWTFDKSPAIRPDRSDSAAPSPELYDNDTLRIATSAVDRPQNLDSKDSLYQERYLSSEEDLSPMEPDSDDESIKDLEEELLSARKMSVSRFEKGKSCDMAIVVSFMSAGRPKMIDLPNTSPVREKTGRSASLALPTATRRLRLADQAARLSLIATTRNRSTSPASSRRLSTEKSPLAQELNALRISNSSASLANSSAQSATSSIPEDPPRPQTSAPAPKSTSLSRSSSLYVGTSPLSPFPPLTSRSTTGPHSFLSSDPYEKSTSSAGSPIIKSAPHKRLRSISQKFSLARISITPTSKKWDSRINGKSASAVPSTPLSAHSPTTPMSAPPTNFSSPKSRLHRNSKFIPRGANEREPTISIPPMPKTMQDEASGSRSSKLVPRGANERAPVFELPPFPDEEAASSDAPSDPGFDVRARRVRKRKSLLDMMAL